MERFLARQTNLPPWLIARTRRALEAMLTAAQTWMAELPADRRPVATEAQLSAWLPRDGGRLPGDGDGVGMNVPSAPGAGPDGTAVTGAGPVRPVKVNGRADRVDRAPDGA